jgi:predicted amidohydrolase YtcJ
MKGAYAYRSLLNIHGFIPLGTDFPIENISPLETFYAAVYRTNKNQQPFGGFLPEEAISTEQALRGITIWAAYANFMEDRVGSLEVGKYADYVVLNKDILTEKYVLSTKVLYTALKGEVVAQGSW